MKARAVLVAAVAATLAIPAAAAEDRSSGFWAAADIGYGLLKRDLSITGRRTESEFAMAFRGGYYWHPQLLLGVELGGWNFEGADWEDPSKGEGITTLFLVGQYYPVDGSTLFVRGGLGPVKYWNNRPAEHGGSGSGGTLGAGWDFRLEQSSFYVTPSIDYSWGRFDNATSPPGVTQDQRYRAVTLRIGLTYR